MTGHGSRPCPRRARCPGPASRARRPARWPRRGRSTAHRASPGRSAASRGARTRTVCRVPAALPDRGGARLVTAVRRPTRAIRRDHRAARWSRRGARAEGRPAPVAPGGRAATGAANSTDPRGSRGHRWHTANGRAPPPGASRYLAWAPRHPGPVRGGRKRFRRPGARAGARPGTATGPRYPRGHRPGRRVAGRARPALAPGGVRGRRYERGAAREAGGRRAVSGPEGSPTAPPPNRRPAPAWTAPSPQRDRSRSSLSHRCGNDLETRTKITVPRTRPPGSEFPGSARTPAPPRENALAG
ncbi:hypothetical protein F558DRAFT_00226 [Streptomyces sp. AmelKG-A3]|nr:hypothetical protein F558DRAFT_00226 [Streptomyces sp. AmelKG-A3]